MAPPKQTGQVEITLDVNGDQRTVPIWPMARLLDVLREVWRLTGTKEGCGEGECGACAVLLDGVLVNSCLIPALQAQGCRIVTIEGLAQDDRLTPLQEAFMTAGGAQCGICTPGMVLAATALLNEIHRPDEEQIREALAGNLCRCTGYTRIIASVEEACRKIHYKPPKGRSR